MRKPLSVPTQKQPWRMTVSTICTCWRCPMSILADHGMYMIDLDFGRFQTWSWLNPMKRRPLLYWFLGPRSILLCNFGWKHLVLHFFTVSTLIFPEKVDKHISWQDPVSSFSSTSCRFDFSTGIQIWPLPRLVSICLSTHNSMSHLTNIKVVKKLIICSCKVCKLQENSLSHPWWWVWPASTVLLASSFAIPTFLLTWANNKSCINFPLLVM